MGIKLYRKTKRFKTKNGTILRSFGFIEGPLMQMSKVFPHTFDTNENKKDKVGHKLTVQNDPWLNDGRNEPWSKDSE